MIRVVLLSYSEEATGDVLQKICSWQENTCVGDTFWQSCRPKACSVITKRLQRRCFPINIAKLLRTPTLKNIYEWLLCTIYCKTSTKHRLEVTPGKNTSKHTVPCNNLSCVFKSLLPLNFKLFALCKRLKIILSAIALCICILKLPEKCSPCYIN